MSEAFLKIRQLREAQKIIEMLVKVSLSENLPELYAPDDFRLTEEYIAPSDDDDAASKIEIKNRYFISPATVKKRGTAPSRSNGKNLLDVRGWRVVEAFELATGADVEEPAIDWRDVGTFAGSADVVKAILLNDAKNAIDGALYILSQEDAEVSPDDFALETTND